MKALKMILPVAALIMMSASPPAPGKYTLTKGYAVTIHGTSNLHDWDETVETVSGDGVMDWHTDGTFDLGSLNIKMAVHSIKSTEGRIMNNNTYKALKADSYPDINFTLSSPVKAIVSGATGHPVSAKINLTIAGVTKATDMTVTAIATGRGSVLFEGSKTIRMTDYNIKPPVALFGTLKTGNEITIHFKTMFIANN